MWVERKTSSTLINLISKQDDQQSYMVISVWGMGGLGKTTLVKEVYQSQKLSSIFEERACITVMRPFVLKEVLQSLAMQLGRGTLKATEINDELHKRVKGKRCLIVLDDLSSTAEWDLIIQSLPKLENASRIVVTTREETIAKHCSTNHECIYRLNILNHMDALDLFTKKVLIWYNLALCLLFMSILLSQNNECSMKAPKQAVHARKILECLTNNKNI